MLQVVGPVIAFSTCPFLSQHSGALFANVLFLPLDFACCSCDRCIHIVLFALSCCLVHSLHIFTCLLSGLHSLLTCAHSMLFISCLTSFPSASPILPALLVLLGSTVCLPSTDGSVCGRVRIAGLLIAVYLAEPVGKRALVCEGPASSEPFL